MTNEEALTLLIKYKERDCTDAEKILIENWIFQFKNASAALSEAEIEMIEKEIWLKLPEAPEIITGKATLWPRIAVAAALFFLIAGAALFYFKKSAVTAEIIAGNKKEVDVRPGGNKAYLTLSDGSRISLTESATGKIASQAGVTITKSADGQLVYTVIDARSNGDQDKFNTISTPKGGQWKVKLPDGSTVWLNAASALTYPVTFAGKQKRSVELSGEAYFEIAKDTSHPFIVKTNRHDVAVLGTHFNINSYSNEASTKTTLLEGSIQIHNSLLKPGEQASAGDKFTVTKVDTSLVVAWKNGVFKLDGTPLKELMRQIARWYDIEVVYEGNFNNRKFYGEIERSYSLREVLNVLERSKVRFRLEPGKAAHDPALLVVTP